MCLRGWSLRGTFDKDTSPRFHQQSNAISSQELPPGEGRTEIVEDDPRSYTSEDTQKAPPKVVPSSWRDPRRGIGGKKRPRIPEGSTPEKLTTERKGRSRRRTRTAKLVTPGQKEYTRSGLGLNCFPAFLTLNREFTVTTALSCKIQDNCTQ